MRAPMTRLAALVALAATLATGPAAAIDNGGPIDLAIAAGVVGEQADGLLGFVNPPTSVQADLQRRVSEINIRRRGVYADVAQRTAETVERVALLQAMRQIQRAETGEYIRDLTGAWCRKGPQTVAGQDPDGTIRIRCR